MYNAICNVYRMKHIDHLALEWHYKGIELLLYQQIEDDIISAHLYNNIAVIYQDQKKYSEALNFYQKSIDYSRKTFTIKSSRYRFIL